MLRTVCRVAGAHPAAALALWQRLYEWVERTELSNAVSSRIFEWVVCAMGEPFTGAARSVACLR